MIKKDINFQSQFKLMLDDNHRLFATSPEERLRNKMKTSGIKERASSKMSTH